MRGTRTGAAVVLLWLASPAADATAQEGAGSLLGAPAPGIEVPLQYGNPSDSQALLEAAPPAPAAEAAPASDPAGAPASAPGTAAPGTGAAAAAGEAPYEAPLNQRVVGFATSTQTAPAEPVDGSSLYTGVIPAVTDSLPHIAYQQERGAAGTANTLTWIGFQPFPGVTRVFLQTGRPAQYQVRESPDGRTIVVRLRTTEINISNLRRDIDASPFGRVVQTIDAARTGDGITEVTITLADATGRRVTAEGTYLFLDFAEPTP